MGVTYHCTNVNCSFPGEDKFEMTFNIESIVDTDNFATVFCPFCKKPMVTSELLSSRQKSAADINETHRPS